MLFSYFTGITIANAEKFRGEIQTFGEVTAFKAYLAEKPPVLDGKLDDEVWFINNELSYAEGELPPACKMGALWDQDNLYIGLRAAGDNISTISFVISGSLEGNIHTITYDVSTNSFNKNDVGATAAVQYNAGKLEMEIALPFSSAGIVINEYYMPIYLNCKLESDNGSVSFSGSSIPSEGAKIILAGEYILLGDTCENLPAKNWVKERFPDSNYCYTNDSINSAGKPNFAEDEYFLFYHDGTNEKSAGIMKRGIDYKDGDIDVEFDLTLRDLVSVSINQAWRGFTFCIKGAVKTIKFAFVKNENNKIEFHVLYDFNSVNRVGRSEYVETSLDFNETARIKVSVTKDNTLTLYINDVQEGYFTDLNCLEGGNFIEFMTSVYNKIEGTVVAELDNILVTVPAYSSNERIVEDVLEKIDFELIKGLNDKPEMVTSDLYLPKVFNLPYISGSIPLIWESSNPDMITDDGVVQKAGGGQWVTLTVTATKGEISLSKTIEVYIPVFSETGMVGLVYNDENPYNGKLRSIGVDTDFTLDINCNSVGLDLGEQTRINRLVLRDSDSISRLSAKDLSIYISDDNVNYTKIRGWDFIKQGAVCTIYNFDVTTRYIKVHCHLDETEGADFTNNLQEILSAGYSDELLGANNGTFRYKKEIIVNNPENTKAYDGIIYLTLEGLDIPEVYLKPDKSDIRFVMEENISRILYHYYDGKGFYVRIPEIQPNDSQKITVYYGNPSAESVSNGQGTFEIEYGNRTVKDLTVSSVFNDNLVVQQMPDGSLIAIANKAQKPCAIYQRVSTDGGRTWSEPRILVDASNNRRNEAGGFLVDGNRVYLIYYQYDNFNAENMALSDCKLAIIYTDDSGKTWSQPYIVDTNHSYSLTYSNGIKTSIADGEGPNVDYVIPYHFQSSDTGSFNVSVIYSTDSGKTWTSSLSQIDFQGPAGFEGGPTEAAIAELSDGRLTLLMRCQYSGVEKFCQSFSDDYGITWQETAVSSNVYAPNTMPVLDRYNDDIVLVWGGNNALGGTSYKRFPLTVAYSQDDMNTWKGNLDMFSKTSLADLFSPNNVVQPDVTPSNYLGSDDYFIGWWNNWNGVKGILIEDFGDYLYKTKGAYSGFENSSLKYDGWLEAGTTIELSQDRSSHGNGSMKIIDQAGVIARASRSFPSITKGSIQFDVNFEALDTQFYVELKTAYSNTHYNAAPIIFFVDENGNVFGKNTDMTNISTGKVIQKDKWYTFRIDIDYDSNLAKLYLDGEYVVDLPIKKEEGDFISYIQFSSATSLRGGTIAYIDEFIVIPDEGHNLEILLVETQQVDSFETYETGQVPEGYNSITLDDNARTVVSDSYAYSGSKSLRIYDNSTASLAYIEKTFDPTTDVTVEFKIYPVSANTSCIGLYNGGTGSSYTLFSIRIDSQGNLKYYDVRNRITVDLGSTINFNEWSTMKIIANTTIGAHLYLNGEFVGLIPNTSNQTQIDRINFQGAGTPQTGDEFYIDDLKAPGIVIAEESPDSSLDTFETDIVGQSPEGFMVVSSDGILSQTVVSDALAFEGSKSLRIFSNTDQLPAAIVKKYNLSKSGKFEFRIYPVSSENSCQFAICSGGNEDNYSVIQIKLNSDGSLYYLRSGDWYPLSDKGVIKFNEWNTVTINVPFIKGKNIAYADVFINGEYNGSAKYNKFSFAIDRIKFVAQGSLDSGDEFYIDNLAIGAADPAFAVPDYPEEEIIPYVPVELESVKGYLKNDTNPETGSVSIWGDEIQIATDAERVSIGIDLGSPQKVNAIRIWDKDNTARAKEEDYKIYYSNDNINYINIPGVLFNSYIDSGSGRLVHLFEFSGVTARYLKINTQFTDRNYNFILQNLQDDVQVEKSVEREYRLPVVPGYLDNDTNPHSGALNIIQGKPFPMYLDYKRRSVGVDLGIITFVDAIEIFDSDNATRLDKNNLRIYKSDDNVNYTEITGWTFSTRTESDRYVIRLSFPKVKAKYIKVQAVLYDSNGTFMLNDIRDDIRAFSSTESETYFGVFGENRGGEGSFITLKDGTLLMAFNDFIEGSGDFSEACFGARKSTDGGYTWSEQYTLLPKDEGAVNIMMPTLIRMENGDLGLIYLVKETNDICNVYIRRSEDEGETWGERKKITTEPQGYTIVSSGNRVLRLSTGRIIIPVSWAPKVSDVYGGDNTCAMIWYSDDDGYTWKRSPGWVSLPNAALEPTVTELKNGHLLMTLRTRVEGKIYKSISTDQGLSWSQPVDTGLKTPSSTNVVQTIPSTGDVIIIWNNIYSNDNGPRNPLTVALSRDNGTTWNLVRNVREVRTSGDQAFPVLAFYGRNVYMQFATNSYKTGLKIIDISTLYNSLEANVKYTDLPKAPVPETDFNQATGLLSNVSPRMSYSIDGGKTWIMTGGTKVYLDIEKLSEVYGIQVRDNGDATQAMSDIQYIPYVINRGILVDSIAELSDDSIEIDETGGIVNYKLELYPSVSRNTSKARIRSSLLMDAIKAVIEEKNRLNINGTIEINVAAPEDGGEVVLILPQEAIEALIKENIQLIINTPLGRIIFDKGALDAIKASAGEEIEIIIGKLNNQNISAKEPEKILDRPAYEFTIKSGNRVISDFGNGKVFIIIPYKLREGEKEENIIVYRLDSNGELINVRAFYRDGFVLIILKTFSEYIIGYNEVVFNDVHDEWFAKAVNFISARNITKGIGNNQYGPHLTVTRGQFIKMLCDAYGIQPVTSGDNFADAGNTWYTPYLAVAKQIGISKGVGDNRFAPEQEITREEMFTLLYNALIITGEAEITDIKDDILDKFEDSQNISPWALDAFKYLVSKGLVVGDGKKLAPKSGANRAEMAQIFYNLLSK
ncbi:MAG TPA: DUF2341 domain-containing protein [Clostridiaceae bacterium]|nr:DUF2341 domain-containing protein [Clostridiaceae bacterium]